MTPPPLKANGYSFGSIFYNAEFEDILSKIVYCYKLMANSKISLSDNEEKIRDVLLIDYLRNNQIRQLVGLTDYLFDREVPEDNTPGRTDIKIQTQNTFQDTTAYYIIECKRLNKKNTTGVSGLNGQYISNGICRFISKKYTTHNNINGMIGFLVEPMDIYQNITSLNELLKSSFSEANTKNFLSKKIIVNDFEFSYISTHSKENNEITIYHLMFDFSKNIWEND